MPVLSLGADMRRREFLSVLGCTVATWPLAARAQSSSMPVIGFLNGQSAAQFTYLLASFREGLANTGYSEGNSVAIEYRWAEGQADRNAALAADLVSRRVAVIAATGGSHVAAKGATSTIPIVCTFGADPVKDGLVSSLNRPGGNITGASVFAPNLEAKRLELLHELVRKDAIIGVIIDDAFDAAGDQVREVQAAARTLGRQVIVIHVRTEADIDIAFSKLHAEKAGAVSVTASPFNNSRRAQFVASAAIHLLPAIYENRETAVAGGLMSYGASIPGIYREVGAYVGRILKGEKPSDLPILQPTTFEMVFNLKVAKAINLEIPTSLLLRANEVIE